jgi:hypothetical protein
MKEVVERSQASARHGREPVSLLPNSRASCLCALVAASLSVGFAGRANRIEQGPRVNEQARVFADFSKRVADYVKLRKGLEGSMPGLKPTDQPEKIVEHEKDLAQKITDARRDAKLGDIFDEELAKQFRKVIRQEFKGEQGRKLRRTIRQGEPVEMRVRVNEIYPEKTPLTTVPPTLLMKLPELPPEVQYGIVGRDLVLEDVRTKVILDFIHEAIP